jgi:hypothetical protein
MKNDRTGPYSLTRDFTVTRAKPLGDVLTASGRARYVDQGVFTSLPHTNCGEMTISFFRVSAYLRAREIRSCYTFRRMDFLNPLVLAEWNLANPEFAHAYPNATFWDKRDGGLNFIDFFGEGKGHVVAGDASLVNFDPLFWFAGVRL